MSPNRPPLSDVPMFAPCPRCRGVLRARVDFLHARRGRPVTGTVGCPWCHATVTVTAPD